MKSVNWPISGRSILLLICEIFFVIPGIAAEVNPCLHFLQSLAVGNLPSPPNNREFFVSDIERLSSSDENYFRNALSAREHFLTQFDAALQSGAAPTFEEWIQQLRKRHRLATGAETNTPHRGRDSLSTNTSVAPGLFRDEPVEGQSHNQIQIALYFGLFKRLAKWRLNHGFNPVAVQVKFRKIWGISADHMLPRAFYFTDQIADQLQSDGPPYIQIGGQAYPGSQYLSSYRESSYHSYTKVLSYTRDSLIKLGLDREVAIENALRALADYYHTSINAHFFRATNQSILMSEINTILFRLGLSQRNHGELDHWALQMDYDEFRILFAEWARGLVSVDKPEIQDRSKVSTETLRLPLKLGEQLSLWFTKQRISDIYWKRFQQSTNDPSAFQAKVQKIVRDPRIFDSPQFYVLLSENLDYAQFFIAKFYGDNEYNNYGAKLLSQYPDELPLRYLPLLAHPGIASRPRQFFEFSKKAVLANPSISPERLLSAFKQELGSRRVYRGLALNTVALARITREGMRKLDTESARAIFFDPKLSFIELLNHHVTGNGGGPFFSVTDYEDLAKAVAGKFFRDDLTLKRYLFELEIPELDFVDLRALGFNPYASANLYVNDVFFRRGDDAGIERIIFSDILPNEIKRVLEVTGDHWSGFVFLVGG